MTAKKKKTKKNREKTSKNINPKLVTDKELSRIQKELTQTKNKSVLIEEDLRMLREKLNMWSQIITTPPKKKKTEILLRHFKFQCNKCVNEFQHKTHLPIIEQMIYCPNCKQKHVLEIHPKNPESYRIVVPKTIKILKK